MLNQGVICKIGTVGKLSPNLVFTLRDTQFQLYKPTHCACVTIA